ncbi:MAG: hypothetical protein ACI835_001362 [Planctomycetota bacterium]|jgi:hypothetical protein
MHSGSSSLESRLVAFCAAALRAGAYILKSPIADEPLRRPKGAVVPLNL